MRNDDLDHLDLIQSDLDMSLLTQMQIQRDIQDMRGGPTREEIEAYKTAKGILVGIFVVIGGGIGLVCWLMR
jgi:hypothetical protein